MVSLPFYIWMVWMSSRVTSKVCKCGKLCPIFKCCRPVTLRPVSPKFYRTTKKDRCKLIISKIFYASTQWRNWNTSESVMQVTMIVTQLVVLWFYPWFTVIWAPWNVQNESTPDFGLKPEGPAKWATSTSI